jgi:hypothetical protein
MSMFRKKPVVIEARRLDSLDYDGACEIIAWCGGSATDEGCLIPTAEGVMLARFGDWVIQGVHGEFYPCKPEIFEATYEEVAGSFTS